MCARADEHVERLSPSGTNTARSPVATGSPYPTHNGTAPPTDPSRPRHPTLPPRQAAAMRAARSPLRNLPSLATHGAVTCADRRFCTPRGGPSFRRSGGLSRQCGARLARRQQPKRRRRRPSNVVMISPEYRVFTRAGHAMPDSTDGPGRPANSESRSARVPRRRRALRGLGGGRRPRGRDAHSSRCKACAGPRVCRASRCAARRYRTCWTDHEEPKNAGGRTVPSLAQRGGWRGRGRRGQ